MEFRSAGLIEILGGFIQQQHIAVFAQRQREQQSLSLTTTEAIDPESTIGWDPWISEVWNSSQGEEIGYAEGALRQHGTVLGKMEHTDPSGPTHFSGEGCLFTRQRAQQAAFPDPVIAAYQNRLARFELEIKRFEKRCGNACLKGTGLQQNRRRHCASAATQCSSKAK